VPDPVGVETAPRLAGRGKACLLVTPDPTDTARRVGCAAAVCALGAEPGDELWRALEGRSGVHRIGACAQAEDLGAATRAGARVGESL